MPLNPSSGNPGVETGGDMTRLALIGFGEVGQAFATGLLGSDGVAVAAYDLKFDSPEMRRDMIARTEALGVRVAADAADAARQARVVISAVTAAAAGEVAAAAARYLKPGQIFFDVNSASPDTKRTASAHVAASGADYVEGAVMAAVAGPGLKVPILAGGAAAQAAADLLNPFGMNITPVATEIGRASATKLSRSIVIKGLEAILVQCAAAARKWDVEADVMASLKRTYPGIDWPQQVEYAAERVATHGLRRAQEMREAAAMLADLGLDPALCEAIAAVEEQGAKR
jgi:3-hydroxyisobutyrate dehydrogenase-like beta-hydroxyacid dehydrogenase